MLNNNVYLSSSPVQAKEAFDQRDSNLHRKMALIIGRLAEALARDGRFSGADRILDVTIVLEHMYELGSCRVSSQLQDRISQYLGSNAESKQQDWKNVKKFYETRSDIVHGNFDRLTRQKVNKAFDMGFDTARRSLFKLLRDDAPDDWSTPVAKR